MKIRLTQLGYALGFTIGFSGLLYLINVLFFSGNRGATEYADRYWEECIIDTVTIDGHADDYEWTHEGITAYLSRRRNRGRIAYSWIDFYSERHQKWLSVKEFGSNITFAIRRDYIIESIHALAPQGYPHTVPVAALVKVYINPRQLDNPLYGSKENPVPVFMKDLINGDESLIKGFHAPEKEMRFSIDCYLKYVIPKDELKQLIQNN